VETFGEWLRRQRAQRHLTRLEFAQRVGCSVSTLRKIEDDERRPSTQIAELIANTLDVPSVDRQTFLRVARGELGTNRLPPVSSGIRTPGLPSSEPAIPPTNLPILPTPLIGRQRELTELLQILREPHCRMLTCVGPGGMGKTRLAIETATQLQNEFADGIFFVPLASVSSGNFIIPMIADSIGFTFQSGVPTDPKDQLRNYLKEKQLLLLVDNLEHLLNEPEIEWFGELIEFTSAVKIICTSREALNLQSEWVFEVHGLAVPEIAEYSDLQDTSVELFLQRARRAHVSFNATTQDYPAIVRICRLVDGMPLGIELAAAWVRTLTCEEIEREIQQSLDFLSLASRDLPARHRSMRAVFDHSWDLLPEQEKRALACLTVFQGGFSREAAEQVAHASLNMLSALVSKSLVQRLDAGRYDLHELIRQFASAKLQEDADACDEAREKHSIFFLTLLSRRENILKSHAQPEVLRELRQEIGNIRIAWQWVLEQHRFSLIEPALQCLWVFYDITGWFDESVEMAENTIQALEQSKNSMQSTSLGAMLAWQGFALFRKGQYQRASDSYLRGLSLLRQGSLDINLPQILIMSAIVNYRMGDMQTADRQSAEGLALAQKIDNAWLASWGFCLRGIIVNIQGDHEQAYELLSEGLTGFRKAGDPRLTAYALNYISPVGLALGRQNEVQSFLEESLSIGIQLDDKWGTATAYCNLGLAAQARKNYDEAQNQIQQGLHIFRELGAKGYIAEFMTHLGNIHLDTGDFAKASKTFREAIPVAMEVQSLPVVLDGLMGLACAEAETDKIEALIMLFMILSNSATRPETQARAQLLMSEIQNQFSSSQVENIQRQASAMALQEFVGQIEQG
jgi:predicted ATPase/transcriptional regulator with XRE-family HTH domain/predicted negative regulator of RcsB-dependent stress response